MNCGSVESVELSERSGEIISERSFYSFVRGGEEGRGGEKRERGEKNYELNQINKKIYSERQSWIFSWSVPGAIMATVLSLLSVSGRLVEKRMCTKMAGVARVQRGKPSQNIRTISSSSLRSVGVGESRFVARNPSNSVGKAQFYLRSRVLSVSTEMSFRPYTRSLSSSGGGGGVVDKGSGSGGNDSVFVEKSSSLPLAPSQDKVLMDACGVEDDDEEGEEVSG